MQTAPTHSLYGMGDKSIIARIDSIDESAVTPFREFLSSGGVDIVCGSPPVPKATYYICMGTHAYVKKTVATFPCDAEKTLLIFWDGTKHDAETTFPEKRFRCVLAPAGQLSSRLISDIFTFFFTDKTKTLVLRDDKPLQSLNTSSPENYSEKSIKHHAPVQPAQSKTDYLRDTDFQSDKERIASLINAMFGKPTDEDLLKAQRAKAKKSSSKVEYSLPQTPTRQATAMVIKTAGVIFSLIFIYILMVLTSIGLVGLGAKLLVDGQLTWGERTLIAGSQLADATRKCLNFISPAADLIGATKLLRWQESILSVTQSLGSVGTSLVRVSQLGKNAAKIATASLLSGVPQDTGQSPALSVDKLRSEVSYLDTTIGDISAEVDRLLISQPFPFYLSPVRNQALALTKLLTRVRTRLESGSTLLSLYPYVAGFDQPKKFLILMQNNAELRPTGGFIGSVGKLRLSSGKIEEFSVQDVYVYDGQLKGHVDPPSPIADILKQEHWYLRDSNWDPDFRISGQRAQWFYEKITSDSVDGVVAVTMQLLLDILMHTGPVELTDYKDTITAENFFAKSFFYTKNDFFPGSTQKKDFLGAVANALLAKVAYGDEQLNGKVLKVVLDSLDKRDIQLYFSSQELASWVTAIGWSGASPARTQCRKQSSQAGCFFDFIRVIDANLGVNKVNYFVKPEADLDITMSDSGEIFYKLNLVYKNTSVASVGGGGAYTNYMRLMLPKDARIGKVEIGGVAVGPRTAGTVPQMPYTETAPAPQGYAMLAVVFDIGIGEEARIDISYSRNRPVVSKASWRYELLWQKQAGVPVFPARISLTYPSSWDMMQEINDDTTFDEIGPNVANITTRRYNTSLSLDFDLGLDIEP